MTIELSFKVKIVLSAAVVIIIYVFSWVCANVINGLFEADHSFAQKNFVIKAFMLLFTGIAMKLLKYQVHKGYGFKRSGQNYLTYLKKGISYGFLGLLCVIILNIAGYFFTGQKPIGFPDEKLIDRILFIWIWSSFVEEVLFRGLIQSFLGNHDKIFFSVRNISISLPVFFSALFFSLLHLTVWSLDPNPFFVGGILSLTFILGLVAGYYRERDHSIWPAVFIHIIFNIVGSLPLLLKTLN